MDRFYLDPNFIWKPQKRGSLLFHRLDHRKIRLNGSATAMLGSILNNRRDEYVDRTAGECCVDRTRVEADLASFVLSLAGMGVLTGQPGPVHGAKAPVEPVMERARIRLTNSCNLRCRHCFISASGPVDRELTTKEWREVIRQLAGFELLELTFTGGEPLVRPDFFELARYANELGMPVSVNTNALLINSGILAEIKKLNLVLIHVSLDGASPATHDAVRGEGTFAAVLDAITLMVEAEIPVAVNSVITRDNFHEMAEIIDLAGRLGVSGFSMVECSVEGRAGEQLKDAALSPEQVVEMEKVKLLTGLGRQQMESDGGEEDRKVVCSAGVNNFMIFANGDAAPCVSIYNTGLTAGNVRKESIADIWRESPLLTRLRSLSVDNIDGCRECRFRYYCGGGCRARAYLCSGDLDGPQEPQECRWRYMYFNDLLQEEVEGCLASQLPDGKPVVRCAVKIAGAE